MSASPTSAPTTPDTSRLPDTVRRAQGFRHDQATHWTLLITSSIVMTLALLMNNRGQEQVLMPFVNQPLPGLCTTKRFFQMDCPGCGLTRCFISLAHGDLVSAWHFNPAGFWFFALMAAQIPYRVVQLWRIRGGREPLRFYFGNWPLWILLILLVGQWGAKLVWQAL